MFRCLLQVYKGDAPVSTSLEPLLYFRTPHFLLSPLPKSSSPPSYYSSRRVPASTALATCYWFAGTPPPLTYATLPPCCASMVFPLSVLPWCFRYTFSCPLLLLAHCSTTNHQVRPSPSYRRCSIASRLFELNSRHSTSLSKLLAWRQHYLIFIYALVFPAHKQLLAPIALAPFTPDSTWLLALSAASIYLCRIFSPPLITACLLISISIRLRPRLVSFLRRPSSSTGILLLLASPPSMSAVLAPVLTLARRGFFVPLTLLRSVTLAILRDRALLPCHYSYLLAPTLVWIIVITLSGFHLRQQHFLPLNQPIYLCSYLFLKLSGALRSLRIPG